MEKDVDAENDCIKNEHRLQEGIWTDPDKVGMEDECAKIDCKVTKVDTENCILRNQTLIEEPTNEPINNGTKVHLIVESDVTPNCTSLNNVYTENSLKITESMHTWEKEYFKGGSIIELSRSSWISSDNKQQYLRGCLWSPDGTCILSAVNCDGMHVIELPSDLFTTKQISSDRPLDILSSAVHVKEGGTVYDYCWYPHMNSTMPETCCWLATRQHEPIHMWDAFNGELRCSYRGFDAVDEVESALAVAFSPNGERVIAGYKKNIKVFNTDVPGRDYSEIPTKYPAASFAIHESYQDTIATGSWKSLINLYDLRIPKLGPLATLTEHTGGVTYLKFSKNGERLFSGARKDNKLIQWDMRNFSKPISILNRNVKTNQRIYFDLSPDGQWLASGDTSGIIHAWNVDNNYAEYQFELHKDCCNGVDFHQTYPILATTSGQFHFSNNDESSEEIIKMYENSLILWWLGEIDNLVR